MRGQSLTPGVCLKEGVSISVSVKGLSEIYNLFHMNWGTNQVQSYSAQEVTFY